jgi:hypothetical protein
MEVKQETNRGPAMIRTLLNLNLVILPRSASTWPLMLGQICRHRLNCPNAGATAGAFYVVPVRKADRMHEHAGFHVDFTGDAFTADIHGM